MPISGSDLAITSARSGIARSGATRSGWPILQGVKVRFYAIANRARSGATRSGYVGPNAFVALDSVQFATGPAGLGRVLIDSLSITDALDEQPNTAQCRVMGVAPVVGSDVVITVGSRNNGARLFAGTTLRTVQSFIGKPAHPCWDVGLIDHTWGLNKSKVTGHYTGSATTIFQSLIALAPGYTAVVDASLPVIDGGITFTNEGLLNCLTHLAKRAGAYLDVDYHQKVYFLVGTNSVGTAPNQLNRVNPLFMLDGFSVSRDLSQYLSRVYVEGGGPQALEAVAAGETSMPVSNALWGQEIGGWVTSGPQRINYAGRILGGGGSLVGPGAAPTASPAAALASGSGIETGAHEWAVVFVTAAGKSLPGPRVSVTVGLLAAPTTAMVAGAPTIGTGPNPGTHQYALTNVNSAGETTASPLVTVATTETPAPTVAPTPVLAVGTGVDSGPHAYAIGYKTAIGETTPSPVSVQVTTGPVTSGFIDAPTVAPTPTAIAGAAGVDNGTHYYATTDTNAAGETTLSPMSASVTTGPVTLGEIAAPAAVTPGTPTAGIGVTPGSHDYAATFVNAAGETTAGAFHASSVVTTAGSPIAAPTTFSITGYTEATSGGNLDAGAVYAWKYTFRHNTIASLETTPSPGVGGVMVASHIAWFLLSSLETPPTNYSRVFYRTEGGGATYKEVLGGTIDGGYFKDGSADGTLGATAPTVNTSDDGTGLQVVPINGIPTGPAGTTARKLYRQESGVGQLKLVTTIANNFTTGYTDTTPNASLGANVPTSNTTGTVVAYNHVSLSLPVAGAGASGKKLYRESGGAGMKLVTALSAGATTYTDSTPNASLGAVAPTTNTTASTVNYNQVTITIPAITDPDVTDWYLYRRSGGLGLKRVTTQPAATLSYTDSLPNASLGVAAPTVSTAYLQRIPLSALPLPASPLVTSRNLYGTAAGAAQLKFIATLNLTDTAYTVTMTDASLGANVPTSNTAAANQAALSGIPIGAAAVTAREIYRTAIGSSQLKLQQTVADNTTTTATDSMADASLGANAPTVDTSALTQPDGNVLAGSTSLIVAGTGAFSATGGWAVIGNGQQVIRYTGITASSLTGIPATGVGAITATVGYNSTATVAPQLIGIPATGVGSIRYPILRGDDVNLWVQVDDTGARTALAALLSTNGRTHDGIIEDFIQDRRLAYAECVARGQAHLAMRNQIDVAVTYQTHDLNTRAGQTISINLGAPTNVTGTFKIQSVAIGSFQAGGTESGWGDARKLPLFTVTASSDRWSFEDLLRMSRG